MRGCARWRGGEWRRRAKVPLKHICPVPGCAALLDADVRYCPKHQRAQAERQAAYDRNIRSVRDARYNAFYHSPEWGRMTEYIRSRYNGLCLWGYYHGEIAPMAAVHHIEPIKADWDSRLSIDNLIPLSHTAHMMVEAAYRRGDNSMKHELRGMLRRWREEFGV